MTKNIRTDLANEAHELLCENSGGLTEISGIKAREDVKNGYKITTVEVLNDEGAETIGKAKGKYVTMDLGRLIKREDGAFSDAVLTLADEIKAFVGLSEGDSVLLVGLGNEAITPDSVGPKTLKNAVITRHLPDSLPEMFGDIRKISAVETGVLGTTGIESAEIVKAICESITPSLVIAVDALCSRSMDKLCTTVQLTDTGIVPGSGIGNRRAAVNEESLGVPVLAIGIPTVVEASTLAADICGKDDDLPHIGREMIVTPKEIDERAAAISKLVGYAVSLALLEDVTVDDITMMLE